MGMVRALTQHVLAKILCLHMRRHANILRVPEFRGMFHDAVNLLVLCVVIGSKWMMRSLTTEVSNSIPLITSIE